MPRPLRLTLEERALLDEAAVEDATGVTLPAERAEELPEEAALPLRVCEDVAEERLAELLPEEVALPLRTCAEDEPLLLLLRVCEEVAEERLAELLPEDVVLPLRTCAEDEPLLLRVCEDVAEERLAELLPELLLLRVCEEAEPEVERLPEEERVCAVRSGATSTARASRKEAANVMDLLIASEIKSQCFFLLKHNPYQNAKGRRDGAAVPAIPTAPVRGNAAPRRRECPAPARPSRYGGRRPVPGR